MVEGVLAVARHGEVTRVGPWQLVNGEREELTGDAYCTDIGANLPVLGLWRVPEG